jgi:hypothetical protein
MGTTNSGEVTTEKTPTEESKTTTATTEKQTLNTAGVDVSVSVEEKDAGAYQEPTKAETETKVLPVSNPNITATLTVTETPATQAEGEKTPEYTEEELAIIAEAKAEEQPEVNEALFRLIEKTHEILTNRRNPLMKKEVSEFATNNTSSAYIVTPEFRDRTEEVEPGFALVMKCEKTGDTYRMPSKTKFYKMFA